MTQASVQSLQQCTGVIPGPRCCFWMPLECAITPSFPLKAVDLDFLQLPAACKRLLLDVVSSDIASSNRLCRELRSFNLRTRLPACGDKKVLQLLLEQARPLVQNAVRAVLDAETVTCRTEAAA